MSFKWSLDGDNRHSITTKVNGDDYEFNCYLPIRNILTSEVVSLSLNDKNVPAEIVLNNLKEHYGNLFKNDELFESSISLTDATKIIDSQIENGN